MASDKQIAHAKAIGHANRTHGMSTHQLYVIWKGIIRRCRDASEPAFKHYGGRGIRVCERWLRIEEFINDMGPRPKGASIDRIDVNGHYEPANCRWATQKQQLNNMRTNTRFTLNGRTQTVHEWATELGISSRTLTTRMRLGWSDERILTTPVDKRMSRWKKGDSPRTRNRGGVAA